jgi:hypothetical protein
MDIDQCIDKIVNMAKDESVSLRKIQAIMTRIIGVIGLPHLQNYNAFVVRASINDPGEVFNNKSRCSYPPDNHIDKIKLQRANYDRQQVFYCTIPTEDMFASSQVTCILETAWEHIEDITLSRTYATLSKWQCTRPLTLWIFPFCEQSCQSNKEWKTIRDTMYQILEEQYPESKDQRKILTFISEAFAKKENKRQWYRITSAFCNALLFYEKHVGISCDGIMYPSANTKGQGINIALKKDLVDNGVLQFDLAMMFYIQRLPNNEKHLNVMPASRESSADLKGRIYFPNVW